MLRARIEIMERGWKAFLAAVRKDSLEYFLAKPRRGAAEPTTISRVYLQ